MNNFEKFEFFSVLIIIVFQLYIFLRTKKKIDIFKSIFPAEEDLLITKPIIKKGYLQFHPKQILANLSKYVNESLDEPDETQQTEERIQLELIDKRLGGNYITDRIFYALNTYLLRNRGVASDFNLIKDVVDRNSDSEEDNINSTISLPLYLGLLGTFLGIVIGLFQISGVNFSDDSGALDKAISLLLGGVKIAMIASFSGLLLTIINSGIFLKNAKSKVEEAKNGFFTFIQIELLPLLNQSINSTFAHLQTNLFKFNEEFKDNLKLLSSVMGKNHEALKAQEQVLTSLENINLNEFAKANVKILQQLQVSVHEFSQFNKYLTGMVSMVQHTQTFAGKLDSIIERTDNFHELGAKIVATFENNAKLQEFLQNHYSSLDQSRQLIVQSVGGVNNVINESLNDLKEFTQEKLAEIKKISLHEMDLMQNQYPEKWKNLDYLKSLKILTDDFHSYRGKNEGQNESLNAEMRAVKEELHELSDKIIERLERKSGWSKMINKFKKV